MVASGKADPFLEYCIHALKDQNHYFYLAQPNPKIESSEVYETFPNLVTTVCEDTENTGVKMYFANACQDLVKHVIQGLEVLE